jgi:Uma2 family endonuclease
MSTAIARIGPADHGRAMSLDEFDHIEVQEGHLYELGRGVIQVSDVPGKRHFVQFTASSRQFHAYDIANPGKIHSIGGGSECKILISQLQSERHPDLSIYVSELPEDDDPWSTWIPAIAIEIVSPSSEDRDYREKPEEYLSFGVLEYWIIDADKAQMTVLRRRAGKWQERIVRAPEKYRTHLLPGFEFDLTPVFEAANQVR